MSIIELCPIGTASGAVVGSGLSASSSGGRAGERKLKFKSKKPATLNLEEAKKDIGIGDGAEHRLMSASPGWARCSFADADRTAISVPAAGAVPSPVSISSAHANKLSSGRRAGSLASSGLSVITSNSLRLSPSASREPFDFEKRLREDYRRKCCAMHLSLRKGEDEDRMADRQASKRTGVIQS